VCVINTSIFSGIACQGCKSFSSGRLNAQLLNGFETGEPQNFMPFISILSPSRYIMSSDISDFAYIGSFKRENHDLARKSSVKIPQRHREVP